MLAYHPDDIQEIAVSGKPGRYVGYIRFKDGRVFRLNERLKDAKQKPVVEWLYANWDAIDWSREATADGLMQAMRDINKSRLSYHSL